MLLSPVYMVGMHPSSSYPPDWDSRRRQVYKRDNYRCQNCGVSGEVHAHHVVPISAGGSHETSNLLTLCADCHRATHGSGMRAYTDTQLASGLLWATLIVGTFVLLYGVYALFYWTP